MTSGRGRRGSVVVSIVCLTSELRCTTGASGEQELDRNPLPSGIAPRGSDPAGLLALGSPVRNAFPAGWAPPVTGFSPSCARPRLQRRDRHGIAPCSIYTGRRDPLRRSRRCQGRRNVAHRAHRRPRPNGARRRSLRRRAAHRERFTDPIRHRRGPRDPRNEAGKRRRRDVPRRLGPRLGERPSPEARSGGPGRRPATAGDPAIAAPGVSGRSHRRAAPCRAAPRRDTCRGRRGPANGSRRRRAPAASRS